MFLSTSPSLSDDPASKHSLEGTKQLKNSFEWVKSGLLLWNNMLNEKNKFLKFFKISNCYGRMFVISSAENNFTGLGACTGYDNVIILILDTFPREQMVNYSKWLGNFSSIWIILQISWQGWLQPTQKMYCQDVRSI